MNPLERVIVEALRLRPNTKEKYIRAVRDFVALFPNPMHWTGEAVAHWRNLLAARLSKSAVNGNLAALKTASKRWHSLDQRRPDFARAVEALPVNHQKTRDALSLVEVQKMIKACAGTTPIDLRDRAIFTLLARTGMRRGAHAPPGTPPELRLGLLGIWVEDIGDHAVTIGLKGGRRHTVPLDGETWRLLKAWLVWLGKQGVHSGSVFVGVNERVEGGISLKGLSSTGVHLMVKRRAEAAGLKERGVHPHLFRHFFVSYMRSIGVPDWQIALVTGHTMLNTGAVPMLGTYTSDMNKGAPIGGKIPL